MPRTIPSHWKESDRRLFLAIGKRRKEEHVSSYAAICIGAQLYKQLPATNVHIERGILNNDAYKKKAIVELNASDAAPILQQNT